MSSESTPKPEEQAPQTKTPKASPRTLIARYDQYFDLRTFSKTLRRTSKSVNSKAKSTNNKKPVLFVRRIIDDKGRYDRTEVDVLSRRLRDVLTEINHDVLQFRLVGDPATARPELFFHSRTALRERLDGELKAESPDEEFVTDLKTALEYVDELYRPTIDKFEDLLAHQEITFEHLWALIEPNTYVYHRAWYTEQDQILLAKSFDEQEDRDGSKYGLVTCDIICDDGNSFGLVETRIKIGYFHGAKAIQNLEVYPLRFQPEAEALKKNVIARGKRFGELKKSYKEVSGPALIEIDSKLRKISASGRVMIDPVAFRRFQPNAEYNQEVYKVLDRTSLTDGQYMICNPFALGFCFATKTWCGFALDRLTDIVWSDEPFESLVLGEKKKQLIHALVEQHAARAKVYDDVVCGKGRGLIGLLSGNPGCGKTLTAEAIAEVTRRPLYVVSAGELGTRPSELDNALVDILERARMWDAVLLLDEAEVFLQERKTDDLKRNALVSIFLRQLEYYQGILILTTNLAAHFDPALESRIHFCLHYADLDYQARLTIWKTFVAKSIARTISDSDLERLAQLKLNGRQIKNAVGSAQSIALQHKASLSVDHIDTVLEVMSEWQKALAGGE
ncbi:P-loop containing nucleoside triphosphate hydrolase protein [Armillaria gallica]|uniref:P-loop containing nucleoside triphosphate hydrolase protein n=1 Tax=Armillaria gallica TaxID=47427 RepID=A0A2H3DQF3_ARMGA|nr:P-loop containing nucleoside triphosphate hydrolase protein [Armillaria gallica]